MPGVRLESADVLGHADNRFLHDFLSLGVVEPRLARHVVDQLPIQLEELSPTRVIPPILESVQETVPRRDGLVPGLVRRNGCGRIRRCHKLYT